MGSKRKLSLPEFLEVRPVFSLDEATEAFQPTGGRTAMVERLKHHVGSGRLVRATRGVYAAVPAGVPADQFVPDPFLVARTVRPDAIFAYHAAFDLLGVAHSAWNRFAVFTAKRRTMLELSNARLEFLAHPHALADLDKNLGTQQVEHRGFLLRVTGPERTLVEGFRRLDRVGGVDEHFNCANAFPSLDLKLLTRVLEAYDAVLLWAMTGWFLEYFREQFHVPNAFLQALEKHRPASPRYLQRHQRGGTLVHRWNLIVPDGLLHGEPDEA